MNLLKSASNTRAWTKRLFARPYTYELSIKGEKEYVEFLSELGYIHLDNPDGFVDQFINPDILKGILSQ